MQFALLMAIRIIMILHLPGIIKRLPADLSQVLHPLADVIRCKQVM